MFYLLGSGSKFADIGFGDINSIKGNIIAVIDEDYDPSYNYEITEDGYRKVSRSIGASINSTTDKHPELTPLP